MGQILSIPFILIGIYLMVSKSKKHANYTFDTTNRNQ
jgi:prolipoprotein diacylglyceryltransferase